MTDLETLLRTTLTARADTVDSGPEWAGAPHRRRWMAPVAAAAAVLLAVGVAIALRTGGSNEEGAAGSCVANLPAPWRSAITSLPHDSLTADVQAIAPDGTAYLADNGELTAVSPSGARSTVFRVPNPDNEGIDGVYADTKHVLVTMTWLPLGASHWQPADSLRDPVTLDVYLIDRGTGTASRITGMSRADLEAGRNVVDDAVLLGGKVYWDLRPNGRSLRGTLVRFDPATKRTKTIVHANMAAPTVVGDDLFWAYGEYGADTGARRTSPYVVLNKTSVRDGAAYATLTDGIVHWAAVRTETTDTKRDVRIRTLHSPTLLAVAGPYVFFHDESNDSQDRLWVLDSRTRATAPLGRYAGTVFSSNGHVATALGADGGLVRLDTNGLPALTCR